MSLLNLRIPVRFLRGSYPRLVLTVVALSCGVALVCAIDLVNRAVLRAFTEVVDAMAGRAAFHVVAGGSAMFPEEVAEQVARVPGVEAAVPVVNGTAFTTDASGDLLTVHGVDLTHDSAVRMYSTQDLNGREVGDVLEFLNQSDSVILTREFAARKGVGRGDSIELETPTGKKAFTVRGLLEPEGVARVYGGNLVVMDLFAAEAAFTAPGRVNRIDVIAKRQSDLSALADDIARILPAGLKVETPTQRKADLNAVMSSLHTMLNGLSIVALLAAFLIAFNRLSVVFDTRTWQLGVVRGLGVRARVLERELLKESFLLGTIGTVLGVPMGVALGYLILPVITATTALNYKLVAAEGELRLNWVSVLLAAGLGVGASILAAMVPSWRVSRMELIEAIQSRGTERRVAPDRWLRSARWATLISAVVAVLLQAQTEEAGWGLVATGLLAVTAALAAPLVQELLRNWMSTAMFRFVGGSTAYSRAIVSQYPRRSSLTIAMLGVGLGAVVWLATVARSFEASLLNTMPTVLRGDLIISSTRVASGAIEAPMNEDVVATVRGLRGVAAAVGERAIDWTFKGGPIALSGYDPEYFAGGVFGDWHLVGEPLPQWREQIASGQGALASSNFIRNVGGAVGETVELVAPGGPVQLQIVGVTEDFLSPRGTLEVSRAVLQRSWGDRLVTHVLVRLADGADPRAVTESAQASLKERFSIKVLSIAALVDHLAQQVRRAFLPVQILGGVVLLVVLIGMADTLAANVHDRTRELGTARAVGLQGRFLNRLIVLEALLIGCLGLLLALVTGLALGLLWVEWTFVYLLGWVLAFHIPALTFAVVICSTLMICVLAALPMARRVSSLEPGVALRYE